MENIKQREEASTLNNFKNAATEGTVPAVGDDIIDVAAQIAEQILLSPFYSELTNIKRDSMASQKN